jgi:excisionase family DNA binding protein
MSSDSRIALALITALDDEALDLLAARLAPRLSDNGRDDTRPIAYTVATLAAQLGLSPRAIRGAIDRGELQAVRRGRHYIIAASAVETWTMPEAGRSVRRASAQRSRPTSGRGVMATALAKVETTGYSTGQGKSAPAVRKHPGAGNRRIGPDAHLR